MRIAVAGGGIAGLTAAVALTRCGLAVEVYERAPAPRELGAGIQLSPNAMAVLEQLGLAESLAPLATEPDAIEIRDGRTGSLLTRIPLGIAALHRYGAPYKLVHRADLQAVLLEAVQSLGIPIHFDAEVAQASADTSGVDFLAGNQERRSDVLICADGVFSHLRTGSFGLPGAQKLEKVAWRGTVPAGDVPTAINQDVTGLWFAPGAHVVHYPVSAGADLNVVLVSSELDEAGALPAAGLAPPLRHLLETVPRWTQWPLNVVDAEQSWSKGRMVLIGDAAHAMAPSAAQGGAQAIEDAWVLADCLRAGSSGEPAAALSRFQSLRQPRVARIGREALRNLAIYNMAGPGAFIRNKVIAALPSSLLVARLDWIYRPLQPEIP